MSDLSYLKRCSSWRVRLATRIALSDVAAGQLKPLRYFVIGLLLCERKGLMERVKKIRARLIRQQSAPLSEGNFTFDLHCSARRARSALWILTRCPSSLAELFAGVIVFSGVRVKLKADSQTEHDSTT